MKLLWKRTDQRSDDDAQDQGYDVSPGREGDVFLDDDDETKNEAEDKDGNVPPPRRLLVVLGHVSVMAIVIAATSSALVGPDDIATPEHKAMSDQSSNLR